jgi:putative endonuclease
MSNVRRTTLYTGVTNNLLRRASQHLNGEGGFTARYHCDRLVFYEVYQDSYNAIAREKAIKAGPRIRKLALIDDMNPDWRDLYEQL